MVGAGVAVLASGGLQALTPFGAAQTRPALVRPTPVPTSERPRETLQLGVLSTTAIAAPNPAPTISSPTRTPAPSVTASRQLTPTAEDAWLGVLPELERAWGSDTQGTVALLDSFVARFPDYAPARDKLYAALIASGAELAAAGETEAAAARLEQAQTLLPARGEAAAAARALTPTPSPTLPPQALDLPPAVPPAQRVVVAPARPRPALAPPAVVGSPPTPTKQPFSPPGR